MIRFKCPHCKKPLSVKDELAGKRAACPACRKPMVIPALVAPPANLEDYAAAALTDVAAAPKDDVAAKPIKFTCNWCDEAVEFPADLAGKQAPCPACKRIVKVPLPKADRPKDWRDVNKKGPAAALINLPEQLEGAWGTEVKGRVSRESLEDADVLPDVEAEPVGVAGWIRRGLIAAAVVGAVALLFVTTMRRREDRQHEKAVKEALAYLEEHPDPLLKAAVYRNAAELALGDGKLKDAILEFKKAQATIAQIKSKDHPLDQDLLLLDLALLGTWFGGEEDDFRAKKRMKKNEIVEHIRPTLALIKEKDARIIAYREVAAALIARDQIPDAISIANILNNPAKPDDTKESPARPQQIAVRFGKGDGKPDDKLKLPDLKAPPDGFARVAYAEGYAWKGDLAKAKELALFNGNPYHRFEATLGVASVLLADKGSSEAALHAAPFVDEALKMLLGDKKTVRSAAPWHVLQLMRVSSRTDHADRAKELLSSKDLTPPFTRRAQYEWLLAHMEKAGPKITQEQLVKELPDKEGPNRGLAWIAIGRHLAQHGGAAISPEGDDSRYSVFFDLGQALGSQDKRH
jgi:hypothetical protein